MRKVDKKPRLLGIDLCRGLAAFAVIVVHSGDETWGVPVSYWALQFRTLFYFAVPFFLAVSFFFTMRNIGNDISLKILRSKSQRILIPYAIWSTFYLLFGTIYFAITNQSDRLNELLQDPLAVILLGSASYHLYFLPLLFAGILLIFPVNYLLKRKNGIKIIGLLFIFSIITNQITVWSGNSFSLNPPVAFPSFLNLAELNPATYQIVRFLLMQIAWMLKCLPYICLSIILNHLLLQFEINMYKNKVLLCLFFSMFMLVNSFRAEFILSELSSVVSAFSFLLFGFCLSSFLKDSKILRSLGNCSFGIYLIHPILKRIITIVFTFAIPKLASQVSIVSILCFSISTFLVSWLVVLILGQNKKLAKYMFGN